MVLVIALCNGKNMRFQTVEADEVLAFRRPTSSIFQNSHTRNHSSSKTETWASKKADKKGYLA